MWTGAGILLPQLLSMPNSGWARHGMKIFWLCIFGAHKYSVLKRTGSSSSTENRHLLKEHIMGPVVAWSAWSEWRLSPHVRSQYSVHQNQNAKYRKFLYEIGRMCKAYCNWVLSTWCSISSEGINVTLSENSNKYKLKSIAAPIQGKEKYLARQCTICATNKMCT